MGVRRNPLFILGWVFLTGRFCFAQNLTLPLHGYFHAGRGMPVGADFSGGGVVEISGEGAITSRAVGEAGGHVVFPFLAIDARVRATGLELHGLEDSDCLVGDGGDDPAAAGEIFSSARVIVVRLDPVHPILGPAMAWESLDGLVVTPIGLANISEETLEELNAGGVTIAVEGGSEPGAGLAWGREGGFWVARGVRGISAGVNPDAFAPTMQWMGGKSWDFRREIVLLGMLFGILAGGICLSRSRWAVGAVVGLAAVFCWGADWNNRGVSPVESAAGIVEFDVDRELAVADVWAYVRSHRDADFDLDVSGLVHPMAMEDEQWKNWNLVLWCGSDGRPISLRGRLAADEALAVMMRRVTGAGISFAGEVDSPMRFLAGGELYGAYEIAGQNGAGVRDAETEQTRWGTIVLRAIN
jgi:hypothetical protein